MIVFIVEYTTDMHKVYIGIVETRDYPTCWECVDKPAFDCGEGLCSSFPEEAICHEAQCALENPPDCSTDSYCGEGNIMSRELVAVDHPTCWECQDYSLEDCGEDARCQIGSDDKPECVPISSECSDVVPPTCGGPICQNTGIYDLEGPFYVGAPECWSCEYQEVEECSIGTNGVCIEGSDGPYCCNGADYFEPNNRLGTAFDLFYGSEVSGLVCGQDVDWFKVTIPSWRTARFMVDITGEFEDTLVRAFADSRQFYEAEGERTQEFTLDVRDDDTEVLLRFEQTSFKSASYYFDVFTEWLCPEDYWEVNDEFDTATDIQSEIAQVDGEWILEDVWACESPDWFILPPLGEDLEVTITPIVAADPSYDSLLTTYLYHGESTIADQRNSYSGVHQYSRIDVGTDGSYRLKIQSVESPVNYSLRIRPTDVDRCPEDDYEPNDNIGEPVTVGVGESVNGLWACLDEDWFALPSGNLRIRVYPDLPEGLWETWPVDSAVFQGNILVGM